MKLQRWDFEGFAGLDAAETQKANEQWHTSPDGKWVFAMDAINAIGKLELALQAAGATPEESPSGRVIRAVSDA